MSKRVAVVSALVEGNSLRSTCRMTGVAMNTVLYRSISQFASVGGIFGMRGRLCPMCHLAQ